MPSPSHAQTPVTTVTPATGSRSATSPPVSARPALRFWRARCGTRAVFVGALQGPDAVFAHAAGAVAGSGTAHCARALGALHGHAPVDAWAVVAAAEGGDAPALALLGELHAEGADEGGAPKAAVAAARVAAHLAAAVAAAGDRWALNCRSFATPLLAAALARAGVVPRAACVVEAAAPGEVLPAVPDGGDGDGTGKGQGGRRPRRRPVGPPRPRRRPRRRPAPGRRPRPRPGRRAGARSRSIVEAKHSTRRR